MKTIVCKTEAETMALGAKLAERLCAPAFVALYGDLGAGKTALVRGMGERLGTRDVRSPTFTIVHEYRTDPPLVHFDAYRLADGEELFAVGFEDYLRQNAVLVLEWAERVPDALPQRRLDVLLEGSGEEARSVRFTPHGEEYESVVDAL